MIKKLLFCIGALLPGLFFLEPWNVLAQMPSESYTGTNSDTPVVENQVRKPPGGSEIVERRTAFSKHFSLEGQRRRAYVTAVPLHFRDAGGGWQEIDTRLRSRPDGSCAAETNGLRATLPEHAQGAVRMAVHSFSENESHPLEVSISWQPLFWRYADPSGEADLLDQVRPVRGEVNNNTITYAGVLSQANESYRVIPNGLKHQVTLLSPPRPPAPTLNGEISVDYVGTLELPADLDLYAQGRLQQGNFTVNGPIEVRDRQGRSLLLLRAPFAYEAGNPGSSVSGSYVVWEEQGRRRLAWRFPAAWLLAPERTYPLLLDPTVTIPAPADDTFIFPNLSVGQGNSSRLWVGNAPDGTARSLIAWGADILAFPANAVIDDDSNDVTLRLYLVDHWGDGGSQEIRVYSLTRGWDGREATWYQPFDGQEWTTPGGDYDRHLASTTVGTTSGYKYWSGNSLRDEIALWRTWYIRDPFWTYGRPPYGLLLRFSSETGKEVKHFASGEETDILNSAPTLTINYLEGPLPLSHQTPVQRRVPSPDNYSIPAALTWKAVAIRVDNVNADYDLELHRLDTFTSRLTKSAYGAGTVDLVAISPAAPVANYYPLVYSANGQTGNYRIEYVYQSAYFAGVSSLQIPSVPTPCRPAASFVFLPPRKRRALRDV